MPLVVFDLDGTLVDSRTDLANSVNAMLAELGRPPLADAVVTGMVGEGARVLVERALAASGVDAARSPAALQRFLALYDDRLLDHTRPYDGIPELLRSIADVATLAVLTNKPGAASRRILAGLGLLPLFADVIGGDGGHARKPDPAALRYLMAQHHAPPGETLMVGDSRIDLDTARNAGVRACLARYGFGFTMAPDDLAGVLVAESPAAAGPLIIAALSAGRARDARPPSASGPRR